MAIEATNKSLGARSADKFFFFFCSIRKMQKKIDTIVHRTLIANMTPTISTI